MHTGIAVPVIHNNQGFFTRYSFDDKRYVGHNMHTGIAVPVIRNNQGYSPIFICIVLRDILCMGVLSPGREGEEGNNSCRLTAFHLPSRN